MQERFIATSERQLGAERVVIDKKATHVIIYDLKDTQAAAASLSRVRAFGSRFNPELFGGVGSFEDLKAVEKSDDAGLYSDRMHEWAVDLAKLGKSKDYYSQHPEALSADAGEIMSQMPSVIVEFPWRLQGRFQRLPAHEHYRKIAFSRNAEIMTGESLDRFRNTRWAVAGCGVGKDLIIALAKMGAEDIRICDGGEITGHDLNRNGESASVDVGKNHAIDVAQRVLEINPFANMTAYPNNLGGITLSVTDFLADREVFVEVVDEVSAKYGFELTAQELGLITARVTDMAFGSSLYFARPGTPIFNGRYAELASRMNGTVDFETWRQMAAAVIVGMHNIPPHFLDIFRRAGEKGLPFIPQPASAVHLSTALFLTAMTRYFEGHELPVERRVDLWEILAQ